MHNKNLLSLTASFALAISSANAKDVQPVDLFSDTWVAIDGIDRIMPTADEQPLRTDKDRTVGIFYSSWHYDFFHDQYEKPYASDVTKILNEDPDARLDYNHKLWPHGFAYHWGEPELGYFTSGDPYVIRKDMSMLTDAGVDVIILDFTNAVCYFDEWDVLFKTMTAMKNEGQKVPKVCFWGYNGAVADCLTDIYDKYYAKGLYKDLWFYWDGKPLMLYNENAEYPQEIHDFFTLRHMWWGYRYADGKPYVGTEDHWSFGYDMHDPNIQKLTPAERASYHNGRIEQMAVTPAQHASTFVGKSWTLKAGEPTLNQYDLPHKKYLNKKWIDHPEYYGFYFKERWDEALSADPDFLYVNDWNEWIAGQFETPGGVSFMQRQSNYHFVDQYNGEFNRTIQPMKGGGTDNYYMQMVDGIRRYKGVREAPIATISGGLDLNSDLSAWDNIGETFYDAHGDVTHRNYTGYGGHRYIDNSGRNDITESKVCINGDKATFYVRTSDELTPYTDPNWMLLFINADCDFNTGWNGFDYIINRQFASDTQTYVMKWDKTANDWVKHDVASFRTDGNNLVIETSLSALGITDRDNGNFYFKWADNPADLNDVISLCTTGDTAPNRRFCYNYRWNYSPTALNKPEDTPKGLNVTTLCGNNIHLECDNQYAIVNQLGTVVHCGSGDATVTLPTSGIYIVSSEGESRKVVVQ